MPRRAGYVWAFVRGAWRLYKRQPKVPGPLSDYILEKMTRRSTMPRKFVRRYTRKAVPRRVAPAGYRRRRTVSARSRGRGYAKGFGWAFKNR